MKKKIAVSLILPAFLSGCVTTQWLPTKYDRLQEAVDEGNVSEVQRIVNEGVPRVLVYGTQRQIRIREEEKEKRETALKEAWELLSSTYVEDYLNLDRDKVTVRRFDNYCQKRMPDFSSSRVGGRICTDEARAKVKQVVNSKRKAKAEAKARKRKEIRQEIKNGNREIDTLKEARAFHQPRRNNDILSSPNVSGGDGKFYEFSTELTEKSGDTIISWWPDSSSRLPSVGAILTNIQHLEKGTRFNTPSLVIGKYVDNGTIPLTNGGSANVPVFENVYIFRLH